MRCYPEPHRSNHPLNIVQRRNGVELIRKAEQARRAHLPQPARMPGTSHPAMVFQQLLGAFWRVTRRALAAVPGTDADHGRSDSVREPAGVS